MFAITIVSRPSVSNMRKKMMAQKGDKGSLVRASGYTTNAIPGPTKKSIFTNQKPFRSDNSANSMMSFIYVFPLTPTPNL